MTNKPEKSATPSIKAQINDAYDLGFTIAYTMAEVTTRGSCGESYFSLDDLCTVLEEGGLTHIWKPRMLLHPLSLYWALNKDKSPAEINASLSNFANTVHVDIKVVRDFYRAITRNQSYQFLATLEEQKEAPTEPKEAAD